MKNSAIKFNLSKKAKAHLSSLILTSHCGMILVNYDKTMTVGFKMHDRAVLEINEILGSDIARYRYQTREDLKNMD